jgi:predicted DNA-binding transcriptional regulator AlpA
MPTITNQSAQSELIRHRIIGAAEAAALCGFSTAHFRKLYQDGRVPKPFLIGERKLAWRTGDLIDWHFRECRRALDWIVTALDRSDVDFPLFYAGGLLHRRSLELAEAELTKFGAALNKKI